MKQHIKEIKSLPPDRSRGFVVGGLISLKLKNVVAINLSLKSAFNYLQCQSEGRRAAMTAFIG